MAYEARLKNGWPLSYDVAPRWRRAADIVAAARQRGRRPKLGPPHHPCSMEPQLSVEARPQIGPDAECGENVSLKEDAPVCGVVEAISNSSTSNLHHEQHITDASRIC